MNTPPCPLHPPSRHQRGDVMLIVLIFLLVFLLGLVVSMRSNIVTTQLVSNSLQHQKDVQVGDIALAQVEALMVANSSVTGSPLEFSVGSGSAQPLWWRDVPAGTAPPDKTYWQTCSTTNAGDATLRCYPVPVTNNGTQLNYTVLAVVQSTNRQSSDSCNIGAKVNASYYDIYLNIRESSGATNSITETVYKLCTR